MSHWLERALAAMGDLPQQVAPVPNVPIVPKGKWGPASGTFGTNGTNKQIDLPPHHEPSNLSNDPDEFQERAAIVEYDGKAPCEWAEGFARMCVLPLPRDLTAARWQQLLDDSGRFLDVWAHEAAALGWHAEDLFGVDPAKPDERHQAMGLVPFIRGGIVTRIDQWTATIQHVNAGNLVYLKRKFAKAVPLWQLVCGS